MKFIYYSIFFLFFLQYGATAQTLPVNMPVMDELIRDLQLQGKLNASHSLMARPFFYSNNLTTDSLYGLISPDNAIKSKATSLLRKTGKFEWLPFTWENQFNSHHPYGWNNSGMIEAKGYQTEISGGLFLSSGILSAQLMPQLIYAQNPNFEYGQQYGAPTKGTYKKIFAGQSSIRLSAGGVSIGVSTENMWWGPGIQNSLVMSNNAPGFPHITLNSTKPLHTAIGNIEFQMIFGKLTEDTNVLLENKDLTTFYYGEGQNGSIGYPPALPNPALDKGNWRYVNGMTITYNPKWIKNLFIGISRVGYVYRDSMLASNGFLHNYLPVFTGIFRSGSSFKGIQFTSGGLKQLGTFSFRYLFPKAKAELYVEYGYNDAIANLRDLLMSSDHASAFTAGFKKLYALPHHKWLDVNAEITNLAQSADNSIRTAGYWYLYSGGYTYQSRIIGSGMGMGNNMQTITISLKQGFNATGIILQRLVHDPNPDYGTIANYASDNRNHTWQDLSAGFQFRKLIQHRLLLNFLLQGIYSGNYAWIENKNVFNLHGLLNFIYYL